MAPATTRVLAALKTAPWRVARLNEANGAGEEEQAGQALGGDDQRVAQLPQRRIRDRPVHQSVAGEGRVHAHHVLHEEIVRAVVGEVVEGDDQAERASARLMTILA